MPYAIMRHKKHHAGSIRRALNHAYREKHQPDNADAERTPKNLHLEAVSTAEAEARIDELVPEHQPNGRKTRKDAVRVIEYMITTSPEWWSSATQDQADAWLADSVKWLRDTYGDDRLVTATVHLDETTPHITAFVVPLAADGRLAAKDWIGGRDKCSAQQTSYHRAVGRLGLQRGIEGSKAEHQTIQAYYASIGKGQPMPPTMSANDLTPRPLPRQRLRDWFIQRKETLDQVALRINRRQRPAIDQLDKRGRTSELDRRRAKEMTATANQAQGQLADANQTIETQREQMAGVLDAIHLRDLTPDQLQDLTKYAEDMAKQNQAEKAPSPALENEIKRGPSM